MMGAKCFLEQWVPTYSIYENRQNAGSDYVGLGRDRESVFQKGYQLMLLLV